jgi:hypothetical protein
VQFLTHRWSQNVPPEVPPAPAPCHEDPNGYSILATLRSREREKAEGGNWEYGAMATGAPAWVPFPAMKRPSPPPTGPKTLPTSALTLDFGRNGRRIHWSDTLRGKAFGRHFYRHIFTDFFRPSEGHEFRGLLRLIERAARRVLLHYLPVAKPPFSVAAEVFTCVLEEPELGVQLAIDEDSFPAIDLRDG